MKKFGFLLTLLIGIFFIFSPAIIASDVTITCDDSTCTPTTITDFFDPAIYWAPYTTQTSTITIQNTAGTAKTISIEADNGVSSEGDNLAEVIEFVIKKTSTNQVVWSGTLSQFYGTGSVSLGAVGVGMNEEYSFTATMQDVGNEYQNTSTMFDMQLSFTEVTQMDTPTTTSNSNSSSSSSGGGGSTSFTSSSTSNIPATLGTSTQQFFSQLIDTVFAEEVEEATTEVSDEENSNDTSEVLGEQQSVCQNKEWWWIVAIGFVLSELVLLALKEHFKPLMKIIMYLGTGAIGGILLYIALCNPFWWIIGISAGSLLSYGFARSQ